MPDFTAVLKPSKSGEVTRHHGIHQRAHDGREGAWGARPKIATATAEHSKLLLPNAMVAQWSTDPKKKAMKKLPRNMTKK